MTEQPDLFAPRVDPMPIAPLPERPACVRPVPTVAIAPLRPDTAYGDVYYSKNVAKCPRCGATSDYAGARIGRWSWAHACVLPS